MWSIRLQAIYYLLMGLWPILHLRSFEAVTGAKTDKWLVKSIAWLFVIIGLQLWFVEVPTEIALIGLGSALVIGGTDLYYSMIRRRISRVYLLDVIPQVLFAAGWLLILW